jgi:hypothetical protein
MIKLIIIFLFSINLYATEFDDVLCGPKPENVEAEKTIELQRKNKLENLMPPVSNQSPASWCYAFAATDAINYNNFLASPITKSNEFYTTDKMVSPIESVNAGLKYQTLHHDPPIIIPMEINTKVGGVSAFVYLGFNADSWKARSLSQISFDSLDERNPKSVAHVKSLIELYKKKPHDHNSSSYLVAGSYCPAPLFESSKFIEQTKGFEQINDWIYNTAQANELLVNEFTIKNYKGIADLKGPADLKIAPYLTNRYAGNDKISYLKLLHNTLNPDSGNGRPVTISLCAEDIQSASNAFNGTTGNCAGHAVNLVGAYYKNGICVVRIRNSWGVDWGDHGYKDISVDDLLKTQEKETRSGGMNDLYRADWLTKAAPSSKTDVRQNLIKDFGESQNGIVEHTFTDTGYITKWKDNVKTKPSK